MNNRSIDVEPFLSQSVPRKTAAAILALTDTRLDQLVKEGVIERKGKNNGFIVRDLVHSYVNFLKLKIEGQARTQTGNMAQLARAKEIDLRMAREERTIIDIGEALQTVDEISGELLQSLSSLPARITREPRERQRIESIIDSERLRITDRFKQRASALRSGSQDDEANDEEDTGPVGD